MKRLILITLATTMASTASDNPFKRGHSEGDVLIPVPQHEWADSSSNSYKKVKVKPDLNIVLSDKLFLYEIPEGLEGTYPNVSIIDISNNTTISADDVERLSVLYPNLRCLSINGNKIDASERPNFIEACQTHLRSLITLNLGYVLGDVVQEFEEYARNASWEINIRREPPRLSRKGL